MSGKFAWGEVTHAYGPAVDVPGLGQGAQGGDAVFRVVECCFDERVAAFLGWEDCLLSDEDEGLDDLLSCLAEAAAAMGCSEGSVKTHCSRAVHALAETLKARGITL